MRGRESHQRRGPIAKEPPASVKSLPDGRSPEEAGEEEKVDAEVSSSEERTGSEELRCV